MPDAKTINIAGVVLRDKNGQYLMVQEKQAHVYGLWNIPAGHQDPGETLQQAATREAYEETGLRVRLLSHKPIHVGPTATKNHVFHAFLARIVGGTLKIPEDEILNTEWLTFSAIKKLNKEGKIRGTVTMASIQKAEDHYKQKEAD
ncbi:MAG: NUDIX hydrolase [Candidatus Saccharimonadales bacterium]